MIKKLLLLLLPALSCYAQMISIGDRPKEGYINLADYDIDKIKVAHLPDHRFTNATFDSQLQFVPDSRRQDWFLKTEYNGNVKSVTKYTKRLDSGIKRFDETVTLDKNGYIVEIEHERTRTKYFYDEKYNLTKEIRFLGVDTAEVNDIAYNDKNQIIALNRRYTKSKVYEFNLWVTIDYDANGNPITITNAHPVAAHAFVKKITYDGNTVKIIKFQNGKKVDERTTVFSTSNEVLKQDNGDSIYFYEYDNKNQVVKEMTYRDGEYCCTNTTTYYDNGEVRTWTFTNHLKDHKEIHEYEIEYDSLGNITFEKSSDNVTNNAYETYYEYEYF